LSATNHTLFYRFNLLHADPPILQASLSGSKRGLLAYGLSGTNYTLQYATSIPPNWKPWTNYTLTNAFSSFTNLGAPASTIYYRLERQ
jgi:hypothetical protein